MTQSVPQLDWAAMASTRCTASTSIGMRVHASHRDGVVPTQAATSRTPGIEGQIIPIYGAHEARAAAGGRSQSLGWSSGRASPARPHDLDYEGYATYIDTKMPKESPPLFGLHPNAEIGYLTSSTANLFSTIVSLGGGGGSGGGAGDVVKATMADLLDRCPEELQMVLIDQMAEPLLAEPSQGPYVVCALQECRRMNVLLGVITKFSASGERPGRYLEHDASDRRPHCSIYNQRVARQKSVLRSAPGRSSPGRPRRACCPSTPT